MTKEQESKKVYCKDCKWRAITGSCYVGKLHPHFTESVIDHQGNKNIVWKNLEGYRAACNKVGVVASTDGILSNGDLNKEFNCKYYHRKWWKFLAYRYSKIERFVLWIE